MMGSGIWGVLVIAGPVLLALAIAWAMIRNRTTRREAERRDDAVRDAYRNDPIDHSGS